MVACLSISGKVEWGYYLLTILPMSKPLLIAIAVLLIGGVAWFFLLPPTADAPTTNEATTDADQVDTMPAAPIEETNTPLSGTASFTELLARGENYRCTFRSETDGMVSTGEFFTDGERYRVIADTSYEGGTATSNMVTDGATTYVWSQTPDGTFAMTMPHNGDVTG